MPENVEQVGHFFEFDSFRLDAIKRLMWRDGTPAPLTPKAFDLLLALVQRHGAVVEKDELMRLLWPNLVVEENNLTVIISSLRKALGESKEEHKYIVTIPKRGYCFVAQVNEVWGAKAGYSPANGEAERRAIGSLSEGWRPPVSQAKSIAVLPFRTISEGRNEDYLGLGMSDALITKLGGISQIIVRSTSTVLSQTGARPDPLAIGRKLGVDLLLEGWVQRADNRIRVTIQLVDAHDGSSLWSEKFDALFTDIFDVQDKISEQVTRALMLKLSGEERKQLTKRHTDNSEAYRLYLKGRYFWNKRLVEGLKKAGEYFQSATELDPDYALAYVGLADCYNMLSFFSGFSPKDFYPKAREAAAKALELDEALAEAHASMALVEMMSDFQKAASLSGGSAKMVSEIGYTYAVSGRKGEAERELKRLLCMVKKEYVSPYEIALIYVGLGQKDQALTWLEQAVEDRAWESICLQVEPKLDHFRSDSRFIKLVRRIGVL